MIAVDPFVLAALALAFLVSWKAVWHELRRTYYKVRLELARRLMERRHQSTILVLTGQIHRGVTVSIARKVRQASTNRPLVLVIDTPGGEIAAAQHLLHALAAHPGLVVVRVPDECWSAGTIIACGADRIVMGSDANLGPTDCVCIEDPAQLRAGPMVTAAASGASVGLVRAQHSLASIVQSIAMARIQRGMDPDAALALAKTLTMSDADHLDPIFWGDAAGLGLPVEVDPDLAWFNLVWLSLRT